MKTRRFVKIFAAVIAATAVAGGALCVMPDEVFEQVSITAEAAVVDYSFEGSTLTLSGAGALGKYSSPAILAEWYIVADENKNNIKNIVIESGFTSITGDLFKEWPALETVVIKSSEMEIRPSTFQDCKNLTTVKMNNAENIKIDSSAFYGCSSLYNISFEGVTSIGSKAFRDCTVLKTAVFPKTITSIGSDAFRNTGVDELTIPQWITSVGSGAFMDCEFLESVEMYDSTDIDNGAFENCPALTDVTINDVSGEEMIIGRRAFSTCKKLENVTILGQVTEIGEWAFSGCESLRTIKFPATFDTICSYTFSGCSNLESIEIPDSVTLIEDHAFYKCSGLTSIVIPDSVKEIGANIFSECKALSEVRLGNNLETIGDYAFQSCRSLKEIEVPDSVKTIGKSAFRICSSLESVKLPDGITAIDKETFYYCTSLRSIIIPDNVETIAVNAFESCTALKAVSLPEKLLKTGIDSSAFTGCEAINHVHISSGRAKDYYIGIDGLPANTSRYYPGGCGLGDNCPLLGGTGEDDSVPGDINNDGSFDIDDVIDLARSILTTTDPSKNPYLPEGDRDGNKIIDIDDVILLARELIM